MVDRYNYMISAQTISVPYTLTDHTDGVDAALSLWALGSNHIKLAPSNFAAVESILNHCDFTYVFLWYRNGQPFGDGNLSKEEEEEEYRDIYAFTKQLLTRYNGTGKEFYIGNWEGDWLYLNGDPELTRRSEAITKATIQWVNIRQKAVDDAKRDTPHENVKVYHYLEINRPPDAIDRGYDRLRNRVLPHTTVDFVSYSAYDCMDMDVAGINRVLEEINRALAPKEGIEGSRIFIGEFGHHADHCAFDGSAHRSINLRLFAKFLQCDVRFLLYWELYGVEIDADGNQKGHGLITAQGGKCFWQRVWNPFCGRGRNMSDGTFCKPARRRARRNTAPSCLQRQS